MQLYQETLVFELRVVGPLDGVTTLAMVHAVAQGTTHPEDQQVILREPALIIHAVLPTHSRMRSSDGNVELIKFTEYCSVNGSSVMVTRQKGNVF